MEKIKTDGIFLCKVPQARTIPSREGREQVLDEESSEQDPRLARLEIVNRNNQNFATRVMSNGVEVIVAGT